MAAIIAAPKAKRVSLAHSQTPWSRKASSFGAGIKSSTARGANSTEDPDLLYFNVGNPHATRSDNGLQAVSDALLGVATLQALGNANTYAASADEAAAAAALVTLFSASRKIVYLGHSQGAVNGIAFGAIDDQVSAMVLSGVGGGLTQTLLSKTQTCRFSPR